MDLDRGMEMMKKMNRTLPYSVWCLTLVFILSGVWFFLKGLDQFRHPYSLRLSSETKWLSALSQLFLPKEGHIHAHEAMQTPFVLRFLAVVTMAGGIALMAMPVLTWIAFSLDARP